ncbi:MAG: hypothetical protein ACREDR_13055, partial [Blastocatellia bacterium]
MKASSERMKAVLHALGFFALALLLETLVPLRTLGLQTSQNAAHPSESTVRSPATAGAQAGDSSENRAKTEDGSNGLSIAPERPASRQKAPPSADQPASSLPSATLISPGIPTRALFEVAGQTTSKNSREPADPKAKAQQSAAPIGPPRDLSLAQAVQLAITNNLTTEQARERRR